MKLYSLCAYDIMNSAGDSTGLVPSGVHVESPAVLTLKTQLVCT
jgi:hypothetical protein